MDSVRTARKQRLFIALRLASYVIVMAVVFLGFGKPDVLIGQTITYSALTLSFAVLLALKAAKKFRHLTAVLVSLQFLAEIVVESAIIFSTGDINSPYTGLLVLTIVSAAWAYRMLGTVVLATVVSFSYVAMIYFNVSVAATGMVDQPTFQNPLNSYDSLFYPVGLHVLVFYLTALISGYLAERLKNQELELQDASTALKRAKLETDDILRHLNSGLLTIDAHGYLIYFNRAAERILGYKENDVKGRMCSDVFAARMPELAHYLMNGVISGKAYPRKELAVTNGEEQMIPLGLSSSILTEEGGGLRGVIAIFSDLTEAKLLEEKVRANDRLAAIGELSASIAHEIRNPLAAISGSVEVLSRDLELEADNARLMALITKESHRLNEILRDFLTYARLGRPVYNKVELCHIISEIRELIRLNEIIPDNIEITIDTDESIVYVIGDEGLIRQLLMNLAINACESFEGKGGRVSLRVVTNIENRTASLSITDNGPGIDPQMLHKIYEPFYSTKKEGTGLGLAIVHRICQVLGLQLHLASEQNAGTCFTIDFKLYYRPSLAPPTVSPSEMTTAQ